LLNTIEIAHKAWQHSPPKVQTPYLDIENFSDQKLENINEYIKSMVGCSEIPKSA
jgi:hypothetical protein